MNPGNAAGDGNETLLALVANMLQQQHQPQQQQQPPVQPNPPDPVAALLKQFQENARREQEQQRAAAAAESLGQLLQPLVGLASRAPAAQQPPPQVVAPPAVPQVNANLLQLLPVIAALLPSLGPPPPNQPPPVNQAPPVDILANNHEYAELIPMIAALGLSMGNTGAAPVNQPPLNQPPPEANLADRNSDELLQLLPMIVALLPALGATGAAPVNQPVNQPPPPVALPRENLANADQLQLLPAIAALGSRVQVAAPNGPSANQAPPQVGPTPRPPYVAIAARPVAPMAIQRPSAEVARMAHEMRLPSIRAHRNPVQGPLHRRIPADVAYARLGGLKQTFPVRLFRLILDAEIHKKDHIIRFSEAGDAILLHNRDALMQELVPKHLRLKSYSSFRRQMCLYCFDKNPLDDDTVIYHHNLFHRDRPDDVRLLKRHDYL